MTDKDLIPTPPEGFVRSEGRGAFSTHNGPYFHKPTEGETVEQALYILPRHANAMGVLHGGMLSAFLDGLLGAAAFRGTQRSGMTIHLSIDFLRTARAGEWLQGRSRLVRGTKDVAFVEGEALVGDRIVAKASGIFKLMGHTHPARP